MKWIAISQSLAVVAAGIVLPFYVVFLQQVGETYTVFAYLYGTFTLAAALTHLWIGGLERWMPARRMLVAGNLLAGAVLLAVPTAARLWQVFVAQILLGVALSLQKSGEKIAVAGATTSARRAEQIGRYHSAVALLTAAGLFASGWLLDTFSVVFLFYVLAAALLAAGLLSLKVPRTTEPA
jgi:MFS family permease